MPACNLPLLPICNLLDTRCSSLVYSKCYERVKLRNIELTETDRFKAREISRKETATSMILVWRIRCFLDRFAKSWNSCSRSWVARNVNGIAKPVIIVEADTKTHDSLLCDRLFNHVPYIALCLGVIRTKSAATSMSLKKIYFTY